MAGAVSPRQAHALRRIDCEGAVRSLPEVERARESALIFASFLLKTRFAVGVFTF